MGGYSKAVSILFTRKNSGSCDFLREALDNNSFPYILVCSEDAPEVKLILKGFFNSYGTSLFKKPGIVIVDLTSNLEQGDHLIQELKEDPILRRIPIIAYHESWDRAMLKKYYDLGVSSCFAPLNDDNRLPETIYYVVKYWLQTVDLPYGSRV